MRGLTFSFTADTPILDETITIVKEKVWSFRAGTRLCFVLWRSDVGNVVWQPISYDVDSRAHVNLREKLRRQGASWLDLFRF